VGYNLAVVYPTCLTSVNYDLYENYLTKSWRWVHIGKLPVAQSCKNFVTFYKIRRFITDNHYLKILNYNNEVFLFTTQRRLDVGSKKNMVSHPKRLCSEDGSTVIPYMLVPIYQTTRHHIQETNNFHLLPWRLGKSLSYISKCTASYFRRRPYFLFNHQHIENDTYCVRCLLCAVEYF
jgi:hypothetical protein